MFSVLHPFRHGRIGHMPSTNRLTNGFRGAGIPGRISICERSQHSKVEDEAETEAEAEVETEVRAKPRAEAKAKARIEAVP